MANKSFKADFTFAHLNAVIGDWNGSDDHAYMLGFGQAVEVMLSAALQEMYTDPFDQAVQPVYIDALVYPICFCARHFLELFLKRQIRSVSALKSGVAVPVQATHDIWSLWQELKSLLVVDARLQEYGGPLEEYIKDIAEMDITGETFRYRQDTDGNTHLTSQSHINIAVLGARIKEMLQLADDFEAVMEPLHLEYAQKTMTDGLSREQIRELAGRLPRYETWKDGALDPVKAQLMSELNITSNAFGRALKIIRTHRQFSSMIGLEIPLEGLAAATFERLKSIAEGHAPLAALSDEEWVRLEAVLEVGRLNVYSEEYEALVKHFGDPGRESPLDRGHIKRGVLSRNDRFRTGMRKLGQKTLLKAFDQVFPPLPAPPRQDPEELSETLRGQLRSMLDAGRKRK